MGKKKAMIITLSLILGMVFSVIFFIKAIDNQKAIYWILFICSILVAFFSYFSVPKDIREGKAKNIMTIKKLDYLGTEKKIRFYPMVNLNEDVLVDENNFLLYLLNKLQKKNYFTCYALYLENDDYILVTIEYKDGGIDHIHFKNYDLFFEYFEILEDNE